MSTGGSVWLALMTSAICGGSSVAGGGGWSAQTLPMKVRLWPVGCLGLGCLFILIYLLLFILGNN